MMYINSLESSFDFNACYSFETDYLRHFTLAFRKRLIVIPLVLEELLAEIVCIIQNIGFSKLLYVSGSFFK